MKRFLFFTCLFFTFSSNATTLEEDYALLAPNVEFLKIQTSVNLKLLEPYIEQGNSVAMYLAAQIYEKGELVEKDEKKAFDLYLESAKKNPDAQYAVANMYVEGKGTKASITDAIKYYKMAAQNCEGKIKSDAQNKLEELAKLERKANLLTELRNRALTAEPNAMIKLAEFCLSQENFICTYVWLSLCLQKEEFKENYTILENALSDLTGFMSMPQLTEAEEEIKQLQVIFKNR